MKTSNLVARIITGAVYIALVIVSAIVSKWIFFVIFGFFTVVGTLEYYRLSRANNCLPQTAIGVTLSVALFATLFFVAHSILPTKYIALIVAAFVIVPVVEVFRKKQTTFNNWVHTILAVIYIALPLGLLSFFDGNVMLSFFIFIWIADTGAYCAGTLFGKHKLIPRISPKKSVEGLIGGIVFTILTAIPIAHFVPTYTLLQWIIIAITSVTFAVMGDLAESMIKRNVSVKDSGHLLPGHGGVLDRFDSALLAIPPVFAIILMME